MIAAKDSEMAPRVGKGALFDVFDPSAEDADGYLMFFLAGYRAGMAADTPVLVDDETIAHRKVALKAALRRLIVQRGSEKAAEPLSKRWRSLETIEPKSEVLGS